MAEMMSYAIDLRSMTQSRGTFTFNFVRYEDCPPQLRRRRSPPPRRWPRPSKGYTTSTEKRPSGRTGAFCALLGINYCRGVSSFCRDFLNCTENRTAVNVTASTSATGSAR